MHLMQSLRRAVAGSTLETLLRWTGVGPAVLSWYERRQFFRGQQAVTAFGLTMTFHVGSKAELTRVDLLPRTEVAFTRRMLDSLRQGDVFFDVGTNIGTTAVMIALRLTQLGGGQVVAFEPNPVTLAAARRNFALNGVDVLAVGVALGAADGRGVLAVNGDRAAGTDSLCRLCEPAGGCIDVPVRQGAAICRELDLAPDVVKIDVEGFELAVLQGLLGNGDSPRPRDIFVEIHPVLLGTLAQSEAMIVDFLLAQGYTPVWQTPRATEVHYHFQKGAS